MSCDASKSQPTTSGKHLNNDLCLFRSRIDVANEFCRVFQGLREIMSGIPKRKKPRLAEEAAQKYRPGTYVPDDKKEITAPGFVQIPWENHRFFRGIEPAMGIWPTVSTCIY